MLSNSGKKLLALLFIAVLNTVIVSGMNNCTLCSGITAKPDHPDTTAYDSDQVRVPDSLLSMDAVVLYEKSDLSYQLDNSNGYVTLLQQTNVYHKRVKIMTNKGLEDNSQINLHVSKYSNLERLSVHIIKPDARDIKVITPIRYLQEPGDNLSIDEQHLKVSIPNIEIGDVVDFNLKITNPVDFYDPVEYYVNEEIPILNSFLTLRFKKGLVTRIRTYNNMPPPVRSTEKGDSTFNWSFPYLKAIPPQIHSIRANEVPYIRYMIKEIRNSMKFGIFSTQYPPGSWDEIFKDLTTGINRPNPKNKKSEFYQEFLAPRMKDTSQSARFHNFTKIIEFINDSMEMVTAGRADNYSSGYYLYTKKIDYGSLLMLYQDLFRSFNYEFYYVFARDKTDGEIDSCMISRRTYTNYYYAFRTDSGALHYLYPRGKEYKPHVDQVEWQFQGTRGFLVNSKNPRDFKMVQLPQWTSKENTNSMKGDVVVNIGKNELTAIITKSFTGTKSIHNRPYEEKDSIRLHFEKSLKERFDGFKLEEFSTNQNETVFPFKDSIIFKGTQNNIITRIEDSIWSFPLAAWLDHTETQAMEMNRILDYYLAAPYSEKYTFNFIFPYPVELINRSNLQCNYTNPYGAYLLSVNQLNTTTIRVESWYRIDNAHILKSDYGLLKQINSNLKNYRDSRLLVRKL